MWEIILKKEYSICIGTMEICGIMRKLNHAYRDMGIKSDCYLLHPISNIIEKDAAYYNPILISYQKIQNKIRKSLFYGQKIRMRLWQILEVFVLLKVFFYTLMNYDAYIFLYSQSFFKSNPFLNQISEWEYKILKMCKKKVVAFFCGSDSRPPYCDNSNFVNFAGLKEATRRIASNVHMIEKYAIVIDGTASAAFHTKPYISYNCIGNPVEKEEYRGESRSKNNSVVILHAPSSIEGKGTKVIREVVRKISNQGYNIEYREVTGVPHNIVLKEMRRADILVNQMYSDTPMSMVDVEAGLNGLVVVTCGYYAQYYKSDMPFPVPPSCFCLPEDLEKNLIFYITNKEARTVLVESEQRFIKNNWMSDQVAKKIFKLIKTGPVEEWLYDPAGCEYVWGAGCNKEQVNERVTYLIDHYGYKALQLSENSLLYHNYMKIYQSKYKQ